MLNRAFALILLSGLSMLSFSPAQAQDGLQAGRDFDLIEPPVRTSAAPGKIEVVEVFGYSCGACATMQPLIDDWKPRLPADVEFRYQPAAFGGPWDAYARAFYAAEALGVLEAAHSEIFRVLHVERRDVSRVEDIAALFAEHGADADEFLAAMNGTAVNTRLARAKQAVQAYGSTGTPELIVNGRYRISLRQAGSYARQIEIAEALIERERVAAAPAR